MEITNVIFFEHAVETLGYFSHRIADVLKQDGYRTLFLDFHDLSRAQKDIKQFYKKDATAVVTFNFIGFSGEPDFLLPDGHSVWAELSIPSFNIVVDHPLYYYKTMKTLPDSMTVLCIDRLHLSYVNRYYPFHKRCGFLPLAGTKQGTNPPLPLHRRKYPLVFTANYVPPDNLLQAFHHAPKDYQEFYSQIIDTFLSSPQWPLEDAFEEALAAQFPDITVGDTMACMYGMLFIDLYIRTWFRKKIVHTITEAGFPILLVGKDWEQSGFKHPQLADCTGMVDSAACLAYMEQSRISLNVMPWFKDGAHDRIFNAMLQGCISLTDTTPYLRECFREKQDFLTYSLEHLEQLPAALTWANDHPKELQDIADCGREKASVFHTWEARTHILEQYFKNFQW